MIVLAPALLPVPRFFDPGWSPVPTRALKGVSGSTITVLGGHSNRERAIEGVDTVVVAAVNRANNELHRRVKGRVKNLHTIGDCVSPRKVIDAIYEGYTLGKVL